ncbi:MAG TPA: hypothetical protein VHY20_09430, partial [Pirellulales bacterium]|nr:hypothetical protein [Pirellulales bacterium]
MVHSLGSTESRLTLFEDILRIARYRTRGAWCGAVLLFGAMAGFAGPAPAELGKIVATSAIAKPSIAMHGAPALPDDFTTLPYVNPDAPKGGRLIEGVLGTFDSLNPL